MRLEEGCEPLSYLEGLSESLDEGEGGGAKIAVASHVVAGIVLGDRVVWVAREAGCISMEKKTLSENLSDVLKRCRQIN